jgi:hypothetical protein
MICLRNICVNTLHKGDSDDDDDNLTASGLSSGGSGYAYA